MNVAREVHDLGLMLNRSEIQLAGGHANIILKWEIPCRNVEEF